MKHQPPKRRKFFDKKYIAHEKRRNLVLGCIFFWSILSTIAIKHWGFGAVEVDGTSMEPTLDPGKRSVVHRWIYYYRDPQRYEIVVIRNQDGSMSVKRVVGLPGETLELADGAVRINGAPLAEPYLAPGVSTRPEGRRPASWTLGHDQYFVLGDNRMDSDDSRYFGPLHKELILGKIRNPRPLPKDLKPVIQ